MVDSQVTVILRTKDRPGFLRRALADVAAQSYTDANVIVVNDGGNRASVEAVVAESALAARCVVFDTTSPGGRCAAANLGVRTATSPYVVLHDDDDLWHPDFLSTTVSWLDANPDAAGVATATEIHYEEWASETWSTVERVRFWPDMRRISLGEMVEINRIVPISFLYRRAVHDDVGWYDESLDTVEDWDLYLRILPGHTIGFLPERALAFWMQRPTVRGADGNSMFELTQELARDDAIVRDRALASWISRNGAGIPLAMAAMERRLLQRIDEADARTRGIVDELRQEITAHHPVWSRVRRGVNRFRSIRSVKGE